MDSRNSKFGLAGFLIIVASLQTTQFYVKYFLLTMAAIFLIRDIIRYQKEFKANRFKK
ncbi:MULTISPECIES: hypothetical protein [unclassified Pedobacter]|uniref:hypothetical protein n=1 Tax=unclassified Pedobacter TaxID=2628915 RepID=UPI001E49AF1E|nr:MULTISPECIES: hypothetical protein [unclassified Pedobacter]